MFCSSCLRGQKADIWHHNIPQVKSALTAHEAMQTDRTIFNASANNETSVSAPTVSGQTAERTTVPAATHEARHDNSF